ncbi:MAG: hypothetical protein V1702_01125 [Candidatus Woesearchaeota archaeon]
MAPNGELAKRLEDIDIYENRVLRHKDPSVQEALRAYYIARLASHGELDGLIPGLNITPEMKGHAFMIMDTMKAAGFSRGGKSIFPNKEMPLSYVNSIAKESGIDSLYETLLRSAAAHKVVNQRREMAKDDLSVSLDTFNAGDDPRRAPPFWAARLSTERAYDKPVKWTPSAETSEIYVKTRWSGREIRECYAPKSAVEKHKGALQKLGVELTEQYGKGPRIGYNGDFVLPLQELTDLKGKPQSGQFVSRKGLELMIEQLLRKTPETKATAKAAILNN